MKASIQPHAFRRYSADVPYHCGFEEDGEVCGRFAENPVHGGRSATEEADVPGVTSCALCGEADPSACSCELVFDV